MLEFRIAITAGVDKAVGLPAITGLHRFHDGPVTGGPARWASLKAGIVQVAAPRAVSCASVGSPSIGSAT
ncbi:hypothetical protein [Nocardia sp. NPDC055049]